MYNIHLSYQKMKNENVSEIDFDLSRSLKVKCHGIIELAIYDFLLMINSNIGPN